MSWTKEREKFFHYSASYFFSPYYLVTRLNDNSILDIKDLNNKIAIVQKNSISEKIIKQNSPNVKILYAKNQIDNLKKIQNGIADFTIKEDAYEYDIGRYIVHTCISLSHVHTQTCPDLCGVFQDCRS